MACFGLEEETESVIFMQARRYRNVYICAMVNISTYSGSFESHERSPITYSFLTNDRILTNRDYAAKHDITLEKMLEANEKSFIMENIADPITVKDVADHVGLSAEYFTKMFKRETGQNIKEFITLMKVEAAKDMLERTNLSVGMVALELGYSNFSHFSQVFRKYENITPSEYRAQIAQKTESQK